VRKWKKNGDNCTVRFLNASPNIIIVIKRRRMRWEGLEARKVETTIAYKIVVGKAEGKGTLGRFDAAGKIILKLILGKQNGSCALHKCEGF
jgi:hypothetical protein